MRRLLLTLLVLTTLPALARAQDLERLDREFLPWFTRRAPASEGWTSVEVQKPNAPMKSDGTTLIQKTLERDMDYILLVGCDTHCLGITMYWGDVTNHGRMESWGIKSMVAELVTQPDKYYKYQFYVTMKDCRTEGCDWSYWMMKRPHDPALRTAGSPAVEKVVP